MKSKNSEKGAVAVEMAVTLPVLLVLVIGIMEFGQLLNLHISMSQAARETARELAINPNDATIDPRAYAVASAPTLAVLPALTVTPSMVPGAGCADTDQITVTVQATVGSMTGFLDFAGMFPRTVSGVGAMRCAG